LTGHVSTKNFEVLASRSVQCRGDRFSDVTGEVRDLRGWRIRRFVGEDERGPEKG
jgi:hypothetical protein